MLEICIYFNLIHIKQRLFKTNWLRIRYRTSIPEGVAGQLGLKSSRPLSQLGPGSTRPGSTGPGVFSERSVRYGKLFVLYMYNLSELVI